MIVITAGTGDYKQIIQAQRAACARLGYHHRIYDLGGLELGERRKVKESDLTPSFNGDSLPPATFKPGLIVDSFFTGETMCWLDGDCLPLREFEPPGDWDAAVTLRPIPEIGQCGIRSMDFLNAGAVWIRKREFAVAWRRESIRLNTDQDALNEIVAPIFGVDRWKAFMGHRISTPLGMRVLILDAMEWNRWHLPPGKDTRILHFKRGIRASARDYCSWAA